MREECRLAMIDKEQIRKQFRNYRERIAELENELESMGRAVEQEHWSAQQSLDRADEIARYARQDAERADSARRMHESDVRSATRDLEWSRSCGDRFGTSIAMDKLRRLGR